MEETRKTRTREATMNYRRYFLAAILLFVSALAIPSVMAVPTGASITFNSTDYGPSSSPGSLTTNRSTITTIVLDAMQQDQHWKAYIGNVTGTLTLDDVGNNTIYDWTGITTAAGEVYASRNGSLNFGAVACANSTVIGNEQTLMNMSVGDADTIGRTFNSTAHSSTVVAGTTLSSCNMTSTYVNNASQGQNSSASFQEFLMQDAGANLVYVAILNDNKAGYNGKTYDFQMIVAESHVQAPRTYYFYVELGS